MCNAFFISTRPTFLDVQLTLLEYYSVVLYLYIFMWACAYDCTAVVGSYQSTYTVYVHT